MARITSKDVAREAGVSQTTVSFVLNGRSEHGISEETQRQVLDAARRLGYVPSAAARSLRLGRSNVVMFLLPDLPVTEPLELFKRQFSAALGEAGFMCAFVHMDVMPSQIWRHMNPAAVICLARLPESDVEALVSHDIPVIHSILAPAAVALKGLDQEDVGGLQIRHLAARGHRDIAFAALDDPREGPFCQPRVAGARRACRDLGLPDPVVTEMRYTLDSARTALAEWRAGGRVTAVAAFNDLVAMAVLGACRTEGVDVPGDLAVIGVDDLPVSAISVPALSTIALDLSVPARDLAARVLTAMGAPSQADDDEGDGVLTVIHRETS